GLPLIDLPLVMLAVCAVWLFSGIIGYIVSTYVTNLRNGWQSGLLLSVIVAVIPPAFYPAEILPPNILPIAYLMPTTHASLILRSFIAQTPELAYATPGCGRPMLGLAVVVHV